jgi:putative effector of murein hydrolase LrgA (UPF0299 family)
MEILFIPVIVIFIKLIKYLTEDTVKTMGHFLKSLIVCGILALILIPVASYSDWGFKLAFPILLAGFGFYVKLFSPKT